MSPLWACTTTACRCCGTALTYKREYPAAKGSNFLHGFDAWALVVLRAAADLRQQSAHPRKQPRRDALSRLFEGDEVAYYVVQIGGGSVHGIDVYSDVGEVVEKGEIFGMIRIGSQVDLIVPDLPGLTVQVAPGDRVVAGETILLA